MIARRGMLRLLLLLAAMVLATFALGWLGVPFAAAAFAFIERGARVPGETALAAAGAWTALLLINIIDWAGGGMPAASVAGTVAGALGLPWFLPPILTIVFPALLAWCSATVVVAGIGLARRSRAAGATQRPADV